MKKNVFWIAAGAIGMGVLTRMVLSRKQHDTPSSRYPAGPRILILGAGFAGMTAAKKLYRRLGRGARITVVDRHNYHLFTPLLYQVAAWGLDPYDIAFPVREVTQRGGVIFREGLVTGVDFVQKRVQLSNGSLDYDYLIIALGSEINYHGNQNARQFTFPLKSLEDGVNIRNHMIDMLELATHETDPEKRKSYLTFVVVGGGATGVETAAAMVDLLRTVLPKDYPGIIRPEELRVVVIEGAPKLLGYMDRAMSDVALDRLRQIGVEVWLNNMATDVAPGMVTTNRGQSVSAQTICWASGVQAPEMVSALQAEHGKGGSLVVDEYLQVKGKPGVYAVGDNAYILDARDGQSVPLLAQSAEDEGKAAAENLICALHGQPQVPFHYRSLGDVLALGHGNAVVETRYVMIKGLLGFLFWRLIHLAKLTTFRNKAATTLDWGIGYLYNVNTVRLELKPARK